MIVIKILGSVERNYIILKGNGNSDENKEKPLNQN